MRLVVICAALWASAAAAADEGTIVYVRGGGVWQQAVEGGAPQKIADLPAGTGAGDVRWMETTADGKLVVLETKEGAAWLVSAGPDKPTDVKTGPCRGRARPSPKGECVVCVGPDGVVLASTTRTAVLALPGELDEPSFRGQSGFDLAAIADEGLVGFDRRRPTERKLLAARGGYNHLLISPDGTRAVAMFGEKEGSRVRAFLLDGKGVSRQLGGPGVPHLWSWDSTWVLFAEGDIPGAPHDGGGGDEGALAPGEDALPTFVLGAPSAPRKKKGRPSREKSEPPPTTRACVARASGGEVKCWSEYGGLAFSPDSTRVLLKKGKELYVGKIAGVRPDPPVKVVDGADGPATWVPARFATEASSAPRSQFYLP